MKIFFSTLAIAITSAFVGKNINKSESRSISSFNYIHLSLLTFLAPSSLAISLQSQGPNPEDLVHRSEFDPSAALLALES